MPDADRFERLLRGKSWSAHIGSPQAISRYRWLSMHSLRAMDWQAQKIKVALAQPNSWEALVQEFVELRRLESEVCQTGRIERHDLQSKLVRLYSQYVGEWESFSARRLIHRSRQIA